MNRKTILIVLVLVALLVLVLAVRPSLTAKDPAGQDDTENLQQETVSGDDRSPTDETPLFSDDDEDVEGIDVSDEVIVDIGENEAVGGM